MTTQGVLPLGYQYRRQGDRLQLKGQGRIGIVSIGKGSLGDCMLDGESIPDMGSFPKERRHSFSVAMIPENGEFTLVMAAGLSQRSARNDLASYTDTTSNPYDAQLTSFLESTVSISTPYPWVTRAYDWARTGLLSLVRPGDGDAGTGPAAGLPWYAENWGRDTAWILHALLSIGSNDLVRDSIITLMGSQLRYDNPLLGGLRGEVPMLLEPGSIFVFGAADATLHMISLAHRYISCTGDSSSLRPYRANFLESFTWAMRELEADTGRVGFGWLRHKSRFKEVAERYAHPRLTVLLETPDNTWMDAGTDRRGLACDIQSLWLLTLDTAPTLFSALHDTTPIRPTGLFDKACRRLGVPFTDSFEEIVGHLKGLPTHCMEHFLVKDHRGIEVEGGRGVKARRALLDGLPNDVVRDDGTVVRNLRPNLLVPILFGQLHGDIPEVSTYLDRCSEELFEPWGFRTLTPLDERYGPLQYHEGQAWPLCSWWYARACYTAGRPDEGWRTIAGLASRMEGEMGMLAECYSGAEAIPWNACVLQGWSVGAVVDAIISGLWGLDILENGKVVRLDPRIPGRLPDGIQGMPDDSNHDPWALWGIRTVGGLLDVWMEGSEVILRAREGSVMVELGGGRYEVGDTPRRIHTYE